MKEKLIQEFKDACQSEANSKPIGPSKFSHREMAVKTQFYRGAWELIGRHGRMRVDLNPLTITCFVFIDSEWKEFSKGGIIKESITQNEYDELKKLFFGDYIPDEEYLKRIGATETF